MQLRFDDGQRDDFPLDHGDLSMGGGPDDDIALSLSEAGVASLSRQPRKIQLNVSPAARARVNGRSINELALLRAGDVFEVGGMTLRLVSSRAAKPPPTSHGDIDDEFDRQPRLTPQLRLLTGDRVGGLVPVTEEITVGSDASDGIVLAGLEPRAMTVTASSEIVVVRGGSQQGLMVNGHSVEHGVLRHGDLLCLGQHRMELEAPAYRAGPPVTGQHDLLFTEDENKSVEADQPVNSGLSPMGKVTIGLCLAICAALVLLVALRL